MSSTANPAALPPQLEAALTQVRAALVPGADEATKAAAALSCRVLLGVLEARPGQPIQVGQPVTSAPRPTAPPATGPAVPLPPVGPFDLFLARFVEKYGADLPPDPSVPYLDMGRAVGVFAHVLGGGAR